MVYRNGKYEPDCSVCVYFYETFAYYKCKKKGGVINDIESVCEYFKLKEGIDLSNTELPNWIKKILE